MKQTVVTLLIGAEMTAVDGKFGDEFLANFLGQLQQLRFRQLFDVRWIVNHFEITTHILLHRKMLNRCSVRI